MSLLPKFLRPKVVWTLSQCYDQLMPEIFHEVYEASDTMLISPWADVSNKERYGISADSHVNTKGTYFSRRLFPILSSGTSECTKP